MIKVENLSKNYGSFEAVKNISFSVGREQVLGFLGPNGAGKTTIMKILTGYHFPFSGKVEIDGIPLQESPLEIKKKIGYLPESNPLYGELTPEEYLDFVASSRLLAGDKKQKALNVAITACGLEGVRKQRIDSLSRGYRQRVGLAQAIVHDPPILILDEPTSGLDPNQIIEIRSLIRELGKRKTVILSTHILQEVEAVCSKVLILNEGQIAAQGRPEEIVDTMRSKGTINTYGMDTWELLLKGADASEMESALSSLGKETGELKVNTLDNGIVRLTFVLAAASGTDASYSLDGELIFNWVIEHGYKIIGMSRKKLSLEDIFVKLTAESGQPLTSEERSGKQLTSEDNI